MKPTGWSVSSTEHPSVVTAASTGLVRLPENATFATYGDKMGSDVFTVCTVPFNSRSSTTVTRFYLYFRTTMFIYLNFRLLYS